MIGRCRQDRESLIDHENRHTFFQQDILKDFKISYLIVMVDNSEDRFAGMLPHIAKSVYNITGGLPVAIKCRERRGVFIDSEGEKETEYESAVLDRAFSDEGVQHVYLERGRYAGMPMLVSPIEDGKGRKIAAIGVIDTTGILTLQEFVQISERVRSQVAEAG